MRAWILIKGVTPPLRRPRSVGAIGRHRSTAASTVASVLLAPLIVLVLYAPATCADEPVGSGLSGAALRQHLRTAYLTSSILSYRNAREHVFETTDDLDGDHTTFMAPQCLF